MAGATRTIVPVSCRPVIRPVPHQPSFMTVGVSRMVARVGQLPVLRLPVLPVVNRRADTPPVPLQLFSMVTAGVLRTAGRVSSLLVRVPALHPLPVPGARYRRVVLRQLTMAMAGAGKTTPAANTEVILLHHPTQQAHRRTMLPTTALDFQSVQPMLTTTATVSVLSSVQPASGAVSGQILTATVWWQHLHQSPLLQSDLKMATRFA